MFRKTIYLSSYQIYTVGVFVAALFFLMGEFLRSLLLARGDGREMAQNTLLVGLLTPFYRFFIDPILILRSFLKKDQQSLINIFHLRFFELFFIGSLIFFDFSLLKDIYYKYLILFFLIYWTFCLVYLINKRVKIFEIRYVLLSLKMFLLQFVSLFIMTNVYKNFFTIKDFYAQYLPMVIAEVRVNHFAYFVVALLVLGFTPKEK